MLVWMLRAIYLLGSAWLCWELRKPSLPWPRWWYKLDLALLLACLLSSWI